MSSVRIRLKRTFSDFTSFSSLSSSSSSSDSIEDTVLLTPSNNFFDDDDVTDIDDIVDITDILADNNLCLMDISESRRNSFNSSQKEEDIIIDDDSDVLAATQRKTVKLNGVIEGVDCIVINDDNKIDLDETVKETTRNELFVGFTYDPTRNDHAQLAIEYTFAHDKTVREFIYSVDVFDFCPLVQYNDSADFNCRLRWFVYRAIKERYFVPSVSPVFEMTKGDNYGDDDQIEKWQRLMTQAPENTKFIREIDFSFISIRYAKIEPVEYLKGGGGFSFKLGVWANVYSFTNVNEPREIYTERLFNGDSPAKDMFIALRRGGDDELL